MNRKVTFLIMAILAIALGANNIAEYAHSFTLGTGIWLVGTGLVLGMAMIADSIK